MPSVAGYKRHRPEDGVLRHVSLLKLCKFWTLSFLFVVIPRVGYLMWDLQCLWGFWSRRVGSDPRIRASKGFPWMSICDFSDL